MQTISFPGLGIGEFQINRTAFTLFGHEVRWYGIIITVGIILAFLYVLSRARIERFNEDDVFDYGIWTILFGVIGARLYYVIMEMGSYKTFYDVIAIWNGGLAIYGGIIAGALTILAVSKIKKKDPFVFLDMVAPAVMIGQILGRWGNFFNVEAYGYETGLPWRMGIHTSTGSVFVHPTFLYESLWNLIGFVLIHLFYKKKKYHGQITLMYLAWYGLGRMFIEGLRTDSLYVFGVIRVSQVVGGLCFLICGALLLIFALTKKRTIPENALPEGTSPEEQLSEGTSPDKKIPEKVEPEEKENG